MSESPKAVFLSYASQDAEAAKRLADALRGAGVEVWFDAEGGLEHGDEWDAKIRRQIKECVLFIPLISANTQAREEGYFRIEWELAAQRALGIASGVAFILPVLIDGTKEPEALVPDRFRSVQWTKLPGGEVPPDVLQRFLKLWSHRTGALRHASLEQGAGSRGPQGSGPMQAPRKSGPKAYAFAAVAIVVAALGWWFLRGSTPVAASSASNLKSPVSNPSPAVAPLSEARQLVAKAHGLFDALDAAREDYKLAEEMIAQAKAKDATDAEVWAAESQLNGLYLARGWDTSNARRESARAASQRALRLDAQSFEARLAQALLLGYTGREGEEKERLLRELRREHPTDHRVLRSLFSTLERQEKLDEALPIADEAAALPGGDPLALYNKSLGFWFAGRTAEAETAIQATLAQKPFTGALLMAAWYRTVLYGDTDGARALLDRIAPDQMMEDRAAFFAYVVERMAHRPDAALARLAAVPRDWFNDFWYRGPKGLLVGDAQATAGRTEAAAAQWSAALKLVEQRLAASPTDGNLVFYRVLLLAKLGQLEEARRQFTLLVQMAGVDPAGDKPVLTWVTECCTLLGRKADAIRQISLGLKQRRRAVDYTAALLRLDPRWDSLRDEPGFAALVAEAEAIESGAADKPAAAPKVDEKSVAVLAFANLSDDKANEYFSDGISEELLNVLAKVPGLKVSARTSSFHFKGTNTEIPEIARQLGVAYVVEGSVRKQGDKVRITAQLIKAADGFHVWSDTFTRDLKDVFAVQDEIAGLIARNLQLELGLEARKPVSINPEAYRMYLEARLAWSLRDLPQLDRAEALLTKVLAVQPDFARGYAMMGNVLATRSTESDQPPDDKAYIAMNGQALVWAERALALDPNLAEAYATRGNAYENLGQTAEAKAAYRKSIELDPNYATGHQWYGRSLSQDGYLDEALAELRRAAELDPLAPRILDNYAVELMSAGKYSEALVQLDRALAIQPGSLQAQTFKAYALVELGRNREALEILEALSHRADRPPWTDVFFARSLVALGRRAEAEALLKGNPSARGADFFRGFLLCVLGREREALPSLQPLTSGERELLLFYSLFDPLRDLPEFQRKLADWGLAEAHARAQAWRAAHPLEIPEVKP